MATRSIRIFELVNYLSPQRGRRVADIARQFGISERTVFRDLAALQEGHHVPIYHDDSGYKLMDTASLRPLNLTPKEHALLKVALHNPALRHQPALARTLDLLEGKLDAGVAQAEEHPRALQLAPVERSGPKAERALELLQIAVEQRQAVEIRYASLSGGTDRNRGLDPWKLFRRDGAWYVVGRCHINDDVRTFRLDRIGAVTGLETAFEVPGDFDVEQYLEDAWSLFKEDGQHEVELIFEAELAPLVLNAQHHEAETTHQRKDGSVEYTVTLSSLEELARWIVGFGGKCRVKGPEELVDRVRGLAEGVLGVDG